MTSSHTVDSAVTADVEARQRDSIKQWIEKNIGGRVQSVQRLRRWRPVWRVDYEKDGAGRAVLVKGERAWTAIPYSLDHEMALMQVLEAHDIAVPHVYGMIESPKAFVMEWAEGGRDPGLVQEAIEHESTMSPDRWAASLKYMEVLAKMHAIPTDAFKHTEAGNPVGARAIALENYELNYQLLDARGGVDALTEFFALWLRRNVPMHRTRATFVTGDCGQFLSKGPDITAILDVEIGHLGDSHADLACFRGRHPVENMGDVPALFRHYAKASGQPVDLPVLAYHTVAFLAMATIGPMLALVEPHPGGDWVESTMQIGFIARRAMDAMAEIMGVEFDEITLPDAHVTPLQDLALDKLEAEINRLPTSEVFQDWQRGILASLPQFLRNQAHYGRWVEEEDLKDIAQLLGHRSANIVEADKALKAYVQKAGPDEDVRLLKLFHRRILRLCLLMAGPNAPKNHLLFIKVEPILNVKM
jgi:hypothetical protein